MSSEGGGKRRRFSELTNEERLEEIERGKRDIAAVRRRIQQLADARTRLKGMTAGTGAYSGCGAYRPVRKYVPKRVHRKVTFKKKRVYPRARKDMRSLKYHSGFHKRKPGYYQPYWQRPYLDPKYEAMYEPPTLREQQRRTMFSEFARRYGAETIRRRAREEEDPEIDRYVDELLGGGGPGFTQRENFSGLTEVGESLTQPFEAESAYPFVKRSRNVEHGQLDSIVPYEDDE